MIIDKHYKYCYYERGANNGVTVLAKKVCQSLTLHKSCGGTQPSPTYSAQYAPKEEGAGVGPGETAETPKMKQANKRSRVEDEDAEMGPSGKSRFYLNLLIVAYIPFKLDK